MTEITIAAGIHIPQVLYHYVLKASKSIWVGAYVINDKDFIHLLVDKSRKIPVRLVLDANPENRRAYLAIKRAIKAGHDIDARVYTHGTYHVKALVVDTETVYIGSMNYSFSGMYNNAELGVIIVDKEVAKIVEDILKYDYNKGEKPKQSHFKNKK